MPTTFDSVFKVKKDGKEIFKGMPSFVLDALIPALKWFDAVDKWWEQVYSNMAFDEKEFKEALKEYVAIDDEPPVDYAHVESYLARIKPAYEKVVTLYNEIMDFDMLDKTNEISKSLSNGGNIDFVIYHLAGKGLMYPPYFLPTRGEDWLIYPKLMDYRSMLYNGMNEFVGRYYKTFIRNRDAYYGIVKMYKEYKNVR